MHSVDVHDSCRSLSPPKRFKYSFRCDKGSKGLEFKPMERRRPACSEREARKLMCQGVE